jgi:hypothetical protein
LKIDAPDNVEKALKETGYSDEVIKEILKCYRMNTEKKI